MVLKDGVKMSKSAGDAGDPQHLLDTYGADAIRMAMMFAAPPEHSFEWSEHGVESSARWLKRLWSTVQRHVEAGEVAELDKHALSDAQKDLRRITHESLAKAEDDFGRRLAFNTVVSAVMSMMNQVNKFEDTSPQGRAVVDEALSVAVLVLSPITPHLSHLLWQQLKGEPIEDAQWPAVDESALAKTSVEVVIQVNGKVRGRVEVALTITKDEIVAMAHEIENVEKYMTDKTLRKVIFVPEKLINFVVS